MDQTRNQILPTTLSPNRASKKPSTFTSKGVSGFTLIEILLVLGIVVLVLSYGIPVISRVTGQNINTSARKFTALVRGVRTDAILLNTIYRLNLDLDKNTYFVENLKSAQLISESSLLSKKQDPKNKNTEADIGFTPSEKYFKEPKPLPSGVVFNGILKENEGLVKDGTAYIYFFPNGLNEKAILYLNYQSAKEGGFSLLIHPNGGKVDFFKERIANF